MIISYAKLQCLYRRKKSKIIKKQIRSTITFKVCSGKRNAMKIWLLIVFESDCHTNYEIKFDCIQRHSLFGV